MSAEWCEHDDFVLLDVIDGKHVTIRVKVQQLSVKASLKEWSAAGNVRLDAPGTGRVRITGPAYEWRATIIANRGFVQEQPNETVYRPGATVVLTLSAP